MSDLAVPCKDAPVADSPEGVLLDEARRALAGQEANLSTLHTKAAAVISASAVVAGLLGASLPTRHFGGFAIAAVVVFAVGGLVDVEVLRPAKFTFSGNIVTMLDNLAGEPAGLDDEARRIWTRQHEAQLAAELNGYFEDNQPKITDKTTLFMVSCGLLAAQVILWAVARLVA